MNDAFASPPPAIATPRLLLRALVRGDAQAFHAYASDPEVARFTPWRPRCSEEFAAGFVDVLLRPQFLTWAITRPPADQAIGMVFLQAFSRQHRKAEIAFNLARADWNLGLATEGAGAVLDFAFGQLGLNRIEALCMPENLASARVLRKLGMTCEGRLRQSLRRYDGFHDMDLFAALAPAHGPAAESVGRQWGVAVLQRP